MDIREKQSYDLLYRGNGNIACPTNLDDALNNDQFKPYWGNSGAFHCGFTVLLENRIPSPDLPQSECVYNPAGELVRDNCGGSPNDYDASAESWNHTFKDPGGPIGGPLNTLGAAWTSLWTKISNILVAPAW